MLWWRIFRESFFVFMLNARKTPNTADCLQCFVLGRTKDNRIRRQARYLRSTVRPKNKSNLPEQEHEIKGGMHFVHNIRRRNDENCYLESITIIIIEHANFGRFKLYLRLIEIQEHRLQNCHTSESVYVWIEYYICLKLFF